MLYNDLSEYQSSQRAGFRALVALSFLFLLQQTPWLGHYSYWAIIALLSVNQGVYWKDVIEQTWVRGAMAIVGCGVMTIIFYVFLKGHLYWTMATLLLLIVLSIYYLTQVLSWGLFFLSCLVVLLFSLVKDWNMTLYGLRIYETLVGILLMFSVTLFCPPRRYRYEFESKIDQIQKQLKLLLKTQTQTLMQDQSYMRHIYQMRRHIYTLMLEVPELKYEIGQKKVKTHQHYLLVLEAFEQCIIAYHQSFSYYQWLCHYYPKHQFVITQVFGRISQSVQLVDRHVLQEDRQWIAQHLSGPVVAYLDLMIDQIRTIYQLTPKIVNTGQELNK